MKKFKNISLLLFIFLFLFVGIISKTNITQVTSELLQKKEANNVTYLDLSSDSVALMSYYMPNLNVTLYSGLWIDSIEVNVEEDGVLHIGTSKIQNIVDANKNGNTLSYTSNTYNVTKGTNTIKINKQIGEDETIVIGGNNSVPIGVTSATSTNEQGNVFTLLDGTKRSTILSGANNKYDELNVKVNISNYTYKQVVENYKENAISFDEMRKISGGISASPWAHYNNNELYENKTITRLDFPVTAVSAVDENQIIKIHVIDTTELAVGNTVTMKQTYDLKIPYNQIEGLSKDSINKWISITDLNIELGENETISFGGAGSTVTIGYANSGSKTWQDVGKTNLSIQTYEIYYVGYTSEEFSLQEHKDTITNQEKILARLSNQKVSILGDSISTFDGYSNNATEYNNTIANNAVWYKDGHSAVPAVNDTWWMQSINELNMKLLVNNSSSGSTVLGTDTRAGINRVLNLHDNTNPDDSSDQDYVVDPDIIFIYMGINDAKINQNNLDTIGKYEDINFDELIEVNNNTYTYKTPITFAEAYAIMVHKAVTRYKDSNIYLFSLQQASYSEFGTESIPTANDVIVKIANKYNLEIIDLYNEYPKDSVLHPNQSGMDRITKIVNNKLLADYEKIVKQEEEKKNEENNQDSNKNEEQEDVENPFTSTSLIKIISLILIVGSIIVLVHTFKNTKISKYE